jgi:predicted SAM-dependent methyltransferase
MKILLRPLMRLLFSSRTRNVMRLDLARSRARIFGPRRFRPPAIPRMHLGSGSRKLPGWLNVDLAGADINIDMTARPFPFPDCAFEAVVSQHLIEHLDIEDEVFPVFREVCRVLKPGGELWLSTPDMEKLCRQYLRDGAEDFYRYVQDRDPLSMPAGVPARFVLNTAFFQRGMHKNLFDLELLTWTLEKCGFSHVTRVTEEDLLRRFPDFPPRNDEIEVLSIRCTKPATA